MVEVIFSFDVAPKKQSEYLKATTEKIKPYWEKHGCQSYTVWQAEGETSYVKEMLFPDMATKEKTLGIRDAESDSIRALFVSFLTNGTFSRKTYVQKI